MNDTDLTIMEENFVEIVWTSFSICCQCMPQNTKMGLLKNLGKDISFPCECRVYYRICDR